MIRGEKQSFITVVMALYLTTDYCVIVSQSADWRGNLPVQQAMMQCSLVNVTRRLPRRRPAWRLLAMTVVFDTRLHLVYCADKR